MAQIVSTGSNSDEKFKLALLEEKNGKVVDKLIFTADEVKVVKPQEQSAEKTKPQEKSAEVVNTEKAVDEVKYVVKDYSEDEAKYVVKDYSENPFGEPIFVTNDIIEAEEFCEELATRAC